MEKEEKVVVEDVSTENVTLAPTDDIIPAPEDNGDSDIDVPEVTSVDAPVDPVVVDVPIETPETPVVDNPVVDNPVNEPVLDAPLADIVPPMQDIPAEPAPVATEPTVEDPVVSDVVPASADENPVDLNGGCEGICGDCCDPGRPINITIGQYFGTLQESVTIAWRYHLKTRKHHIHVTLNEFYEKAIDVVDDIIEQYQGICGVVEEPFVNCVLGEGKSEGEYFTELKAFVENNRMVASCGHSEIDSVIDEFLGLIDSTNYKLTSFCEHAVKSFEEFCYEDLNESCCGSKRHLDDFEHTEEDELGEEEEE